MEVRSVNKYLPISPQKLRLVCDKVRGLNTEQARIVLEHMPQKGAQLIGKTLAAAMANAENNFELNPTLMYVSEIYTNEGPRLKRMKAGARGRYKPRVKRTSHLTVIIAEREEEE